MAYPTSPLFPSLSSPIHLPLIMPLDAPHRLLQAVCPAVLVVWMKKFVLMEYNHGPAFRILRIVQIPIVPRVLRPDCQIISIIGYNGEILLQKVFRQLYFQFLASRFLHHHGSNHLLHRNPVFHDRRDLRKSGKLNRILPVMSGKHLIPPTRLTSNDGIENAMFFHTFHHIIRIPDSIRKDTIISIPLALIILILS